MKQRKLIIASLFLILPFAANANIVDNFESGLPLGTDGGGVPIGFFTFSDGSVMSIDTTSAHPPLPGEAAGNTVLSMTGNVAAFGGFVHFFENAALDTWVTQDWTSFDSITFDLFGLGTGSSLFIDIIDNRNPGSTQDDAERFSFGFVDDFSGWQQITVSFADLSRKEIGNGAPDDGLGLTNVHGWAFGVLSTPGEVTYYIDNFELRSSAVSVLEPGTLALLGLGLAGMGMTRRKKKV